jgi:hypothetical protein
VACFFVLPWTTLVPNIEPTDQTWLLNEAGYSLGALGRLTEAAEPMRASLEMAVEQNDWESAAITASNLSGLELTRGEVSVAVTAAQQAVTLADRGESAFGKITKRARLANSLHQAGRRDESRCLFEDSESRQAADQPEHPRLYSTQGFLYCDLLLSDAERAAWQSCLFALLTTPIVACDTVIERVAYALRIAEHNGWLLDIALDNLTLARATLYKSYSALPLPSSAGYHVTAAVEGLRAAGDMSQLPHGLLTRAWLRCFSGDEPGCQADLDEAWEIAERGPMPLFQADIQLYRAHLFRDRAALEEARRLIEKHGYHRRDEELADAFEAAKGW